MSDVTLTGETTTEETPAVETTEATPVRAFYKSDYARLAANLRRARHTMGHSADPKPADVQATIDQAANALADILQADSDANAVSGVAPFSREIFMNGTCL